MTDAEADRCVEIMLERNHWKTLPDLECFDNDYQEGVAARIQALEAEYERLVSGATLN